MPPTTSQTEVASYRSYRRAVRAVKKLVRAGVPSETVRIVGGDLRLVEDVTTTVGYAGAALEGLLKTGASGALLGFFFGALGVARPVVSGFILAGWGFLLGAAAGAAIGLLTHALDVPGRQFRSRSRIEARRYALVCDPEVAERVAEILPARRPPGALVLLTLVAAPLLGAGSIGSTARVTAQPAAPDGEFLYLRDCAVCHGERGQGTPRGQSLADVGPAEVDYALSTGRMPIPDPDAPRERRSPAYDAAEIDAIVDYMRPFIAAEPEIPSVAPAQGDLGEGGRLYRALCAACHQWAGEGGALLGGIESPPLDESTPEQIAEAIRTGPVNMPAFVLSDRQVNSIARYVLELQDPEDRGGHGLWHFGPLPEGAVAWVFGLGTVLLACLWIGTRK
ncbi:MAG: c-type cytochrome [Actinomycetota bacterium]|nr:c-type cytochrome [Actinomycetota bacterium]